MITFILASLAAGHGISAAYLLRHLQLKPRPKLRQWQAASVIFPAGVILAFWINSKQQQGS
jgi:disulfide bond formation protein DsbB